MKTRKQLYEQEASELLDMVSVYGALYQQQILGMYPEDKERILKILVYLVRQGRLLYDRNTDIYCVPGAEKKKDSELMLSFGILLDFARQVSYHTASDFPVQITFLANDELYEIIYAENGKEIILNHACSKLDPAAKRILRIDTLEQVQKLIIPNTIAYCIVDDTGNVNYYDVG